MSEAIDYNDPLVQGVMQARLRNRQNEEATNEMDKQPKPRFSWAEIAEWLQFDEWRSNNSRNRRQANKGGRLGSYLPVRQGNVNIKKLYCIATGIFVLGFLAGILSYKSSR